MQGLKRRLGEAEERFIILLKGFTREGLKRFGQLVTRLSEQQLLFFHVLDGFGGLSLRDGTGSHGFGEIAAKAIEFRAVRDQ